VLLPEGTASFVEGEPQLKMLEPKCIDDGDRASPTSRLSLGRDELEQFPLDWLNHLQNSNFKNKDTTSFWTTSFTLRVTHYFVSCYRQWCWNLLGYDVVSTFY
jgi:hypothetical protein